MNHIRIDHEKCIGCSLCVNDCPSAHLYLEKGKANAQASGCIECGHCFAICPVYAVSIEGYPCVDEPVTPMTEFDSDKLLSAMKSRRTIRSFTAQPIEEEKLERILEAGRYSPTGTNAQGVLFTILGGRQKEAEAICVNLFRKMKKSASPFSKYLKRMEISDDFFFKGAPTVIVVSAKSGIDAGLASSYMELMAYNQGLGVLYSGFFVVCTKLSRKLKSLLELPPGHEAVSCLVIGYPGVTYQRIPPRREQRVRKL